MISTGDEDDEYVRAALTWFVAVSGNSKEFAERLARAQIAEPVFGQIKQARGFQQFLLRGVDKVRAEWAMICTAHTLTKLAKAV